MSPGRAAESVASQNVRVAAISFVPKKFDLASNADRLERSFRKAAAGGAKVAVAPEGALDGYVVKSWKEKCPQPGCTKSPSPLIIP